MIGLGLRYNKYKTSGKWRRHCFFLLNTHYYRGFVWEMEEWGLLGGDVKPNKKNMNTSKVMLDLIKLSDLINQMVLETSNKETLSILNKSCTSIIDLLLPCQLKIQEAPIANPLADLYRESIINLQQNSNDLLISDIKKLSNMLFI